MVGAFFMPKFIKFILGKVMDNEQQKNIQEFVTYLLNLTPNEMGILGSAVGILLSQVLNPAQQNVFGNFLELVGQVMLAIGAQGQYINGLKIDPDTSKIINNCYPRKEK